MPDRGDPTQGNAKLTLTRRIRARPSKVYAACSRPELLAKWFGPRDFRVCEVDADVRVGGKFSFRMRRDDGGVFGAKGTYREVAPDERLVLTWQWTEGPEGEEPDGVESLVTIDLRADGEGTLLTLTHERLADQESADSHRDGWTEALDKLEALIG